MLHYTMEPDLEDALVSFMIAAENAGLLDGSASMGEGSFLPALQTLQQAYVAAPAKRPKQPRRAPAAKADGRVLTLVAQARRAS